MKQSEFMDRHFFEPEALGTALLAEMREEGLIPEFETENWSPVQVAGFCEAMQQHLQAVDQLKQRAEREQKRADALKQMVSTYAAYEREFGTGEKSFTVGRWTLSTRAASKAGTLEYDSAKVRAWAHEQGFTEESHPELYGKRPLKVAEVAKMAEKVNEADVRRVYRELPTVTIKRRDDATLTAMQAMAGPQEPGGAA